MLLVHALLAVATGIMHDANHGSFSRFPRVNKIFAYSADLLGASSWLWRRNHNVAHHHYTNVDGHDHDIELQPFARLSPTQPVRPWHRFQHVYMWPLYGFLTLKWLCFGDFQSWYVNRAELRARSRTFRRDSLLMLCGKVVHVGWALAVPMAFHPWWQVLAVYVACSWALGFALAVVFQLAHCVDRAEFVTAPGDLSGEAGARHQLATTVDFAPRTRLGRLYGGWLLGGLEFQVEHHLAPRLPHTYYREMASDVDVLCADRGWNRKSHRSFLDGMASHARHLRAMGRATA
jgi:linoleoyl-CoA desaturase